MTPAAESDEAQGAPAGDEGTWDRPARGSSERLARAEQTL